MEAASAPVLCLPIGLRQERLLDVSNAQQEVVVPTRLYCQFRCECLHHAVLLKERSLQFVCVAQQGFQLFSAGFAVSEEEGGHQCDTMMAEFEHAQSLSSAEHQYVCICDNFTTPIDCVVAHVQGRETLHHFVRCEAKPFLDAGFSIDEALRQLTAKEKAIQHMEEKLQQFCTGSSELLGMIEKAKLCICEFIAAKEKEFASISDSFRARVSALVKSCESSVSTPTLVDFPMAELELEPLYTETLEEFSLKLAYVLAPILREKNVHIDVDERIQQWKQKLKRSRQKGGAQRAVKRPKRGLAYST